MGKDYLTVGEVAEYLKLPEETVYKFARGGRIPAAKVGRYWRFERAEIDVWVGQHSNSTKPRMKALIVDDEPTVRALLSSWLKEINCEAVAVSSGEEALALLAEETYDLVLLDLMMPTLNGVETLREIKKISDDIDVIIVTAYFESRLMDQAMMLGPITVLKKPVIKEALLKVMSTYTAKSA